MAVRICLKNGRCFTCNTATFDDVSSAAGGTETFFCCPGKADPSDYQFCVRVSEIASWERTSTKPTDDPGDSGDPNGRYRLTIELPKEAVVS